MVGGHYLIGCTLLLVCGAFAAPRYPLEYETPLALQAMNPPHSDLETYGLLLPRFSPQFHPSLNWAMMPDPRLYALNELEMVQNMEDPLRSKRRQPSLSIGNPIDVLRGKLALDYARQQAKETKIQAEKNRLFLKNVGKRNAERSIADLINLNHEDLKSEDKTADYLSDQTTAL